MRVLAFDTATSATTVALADGPNVVERRDDPAPGVRPGHTGQLLALTAEVMGAAGIGWEVVERLAVGIGPGTFTGLRIGIATARALASAREIPLVGVSTLESLALNGAADSADRRATVEVAAVAAVIDARRREVFAAVWRLGDAAPHCRRRLGERLLAPRAMAPDALADELREIPGAVLAVGDGAVEFRVVLERSGALIPQDGAAVHRVTAANHCVLAREQRVGALEEVQPEYLRLPDAETARRPS